MATDGQIDEGSRVRETKSESKGINKGNSSQALSYFHLWRRMASKKAATFRFMIRLYPLTFLILITYFVIILKPLRYLRVMENSSETIRFKTDAFEDSPWLQLMHENAPNCGGAEVIYAVPRTANLARPRP